MRSPMRKRHFQQLMHRVALVAAFALVLVPTLGRLAQGGAGDRAHAVAEALPTATQAMPAHAMAHMGHAMAHASMDPGMSHAQMGHARPDAPPSPQPSKHQGHAGDCDYCPLLQMLVAPAAAVATVAIALPPVSVPSARADARFDSPHPTGLGSRGPPLS